MEAVNSVMQVLHCGGVLMIMCSFMKGLVMSAIASALCEVSNVSRSLKCGAI